MLPKPKEMNIVAMGKAGQRYVFVFDDESYEAALAVVSRYARDKRLNLTEADAALLRDKIYQLVARAVPGSQPGLGQI